MQKFLQWVHWHAWEQVYNCHRSLKPSRDSLRSLESEATHDALGEFWRQAWQLHQYSFVWQNLVQNIGHEHASLTHTLISTTLGSSDVHYFIFIASFYRTRSDYSSLLFSFSIVSKLLIQWSTSSPLSTFIHRPSHHTPSSSIALAGSSYPYVATSEWSNISDGLIIDNRPLPKT